MPPRSRLYSLQPMAIGTQHVESLSSYIMRVAEAHTVSVRTLILKEIFPDLSTMPTNTHFSGLHSLNGVIRCIFIQRNTQKAPQAQRVLQPPGDAALRLDALEIPDHERPEIDSRRQSRTPQPVGIKPCAQLLDQRVESLAVKNFVQTNIERVTRTHSHICIRHPQILLPLTILARSHCHDLILQITPVETSQPEFPFWVHDTNQYTCSCLRRVRFLHPFPSQRLGQTGKGRLWDTKPGIALFPGDFSDTSSSTPLLRPDWFRFAATRYYPPGTGKASMRRSMLANRRRVRWLSANNSQ
jgi:hypothetical protein